MGQSHDGFLVSAADHESLVFGLEPAAFRVSLRLLCGETRRGP